MYNILKSSGSLKQEVKCKISRFSYNFIYGDDPYNYCQKCCFNKKLENDHEVCLLRTTKTDSDVEMFICYEGEIWEKFPIKEDEGDEKY